MTNLSNWLEINNRLEREFSFKSFKEAIDFINKVAVVAELNNHHPEIKNIYNKVILTLSTHEKEDKTTEKDYYLARVIDEIV